MHESVFSYTLTKPYPYRWVTWVIILGGIAATALFSVINIAANGYDIGLATVLNPNTTENPIQPPWFQKPPWSLVSKVSPKCQDQIFTAGSRTYSSNMGYMYEILDIREGNTPNDVPLSSLAYHYSSFQDCQIWSLEVDVSRLADASLPSNVTATATCTIYHNHKPHLVRLRASGNFFDAFTQNTVSVYKTDINRTMFVWNYWLTGLLQVAHGTILEGVFPRTEWRMNGRWTYGSPPLGDLPPRMTNSNITYSFSGGLNNQSSFEHSVADYRGLSPDDWAKSFGQDALTEYQGTVEKDHGSNSPNIIDKETFAAFLVENIVKVLYSFILTDLGQNVTSNIFSNSRALFDSLEELAYLLSPFPTEDNSTTISAMQYLHSVTHTTSSSASVPDYIFSDPLNQNTTTLFTWLNATEPRVQEAFFNAMYLCQVPVMRPAGSVIIAVIVANLVFLQALWTAFNLVVKSFLERRDPTVNCCMGCMNANMDHKRSEKYSLSEDRALPPEIVTEPPLTHIWDTPREQTAGRRPTRSSLQTDMRIDNVPSTSGDEVDALLMGHEISRQHTRSNTPISTSTHIP